MLTHPQFDPVALSLGPLSIHWYGLMYLLGFSGAWWLGRLRADRFGWTAVEVEDLLFYGAIGVIVGGRLGYSLFYDLPALIDNPLNLFKVWQGGMSFHGALLGVIYGTYLFSIKKKISTSYLMARKYNKKNQGIEFKKIIKEFIDLK